MGCTATETLLDTVRPGSKRQEKDSGEDTERKDVSQKRDYKEEFDPFTEFDEYIDEIIENDENAKFAPKVKSDYETKCAYCGGTLIWQNDSMKDDNTILSAYTCLNCGSLVEIERKIE